MNPRATSAPERAARTGRAPARRVAGPDTGAWSTVSTASAKRFTARVRARRRRRIMLAVGAVTLVVAAVAGLLYAPWARVERITVTGTHRLTVAQVRAEADPELGRPLLLADTGAVARRIRDLTLVSSVSVHRTWPSTLAIVVTERFPVAAIPDGSGMSLVDRDGVQVEWSASRPAGMPLVQVESGSAGVPALQAVLDVLNGLPSSLRAQVRSVGAGSPASVWFVLAGGSRVLWGAAMDGPAKVRALRALQDQPAARARTGVHPPDFDVSAPDAPALRAHT